jgi:uncharacterized membrane-anchored protein
MNSSPTTYIGIINFLTFGISVIAAVLAIDMYGLVRVGQSGRTWRILIVASVIFVFLQVLQLAEALLHLEIANELSQIVGLIFAIAFAYAFYRQRAIYSCKLNHREDDTENHKDDD